MKLYATTTSERASKGQGGEYLQIDIYNTEKQLIAEVTVYTKPWFKNPQLRLCYNGSMVDISKHNAEVESQKIKGESGCPDGGLA